MHQVGKCNYNANSVPYAIITTPLHAILIMLTSCFVNCFGLKLKLVENVYTAIGTDEEINQVMTPALVKSS